MASQTFAQRPGSWQWLFAPCLAGCILILAGCVTQPATWQEPVVPETERPAHNLRVFDHAWSLVNDKYFDAHFRGQDWPALRTQYRPEAEKAADDQQLYRAINTMLRQLKESHLTATAPRQVHKNSISSFAGVGMALSLRDGRHVITDIIPGSPAERAGLQRGWMLVSCNSQSLETKQALPSLTPGVTVTYGFLDAQDQLHERTMAAENIVAKHPTERILDHGILYLRFNAFNFENLRWFSQRLKAHRDAPGLIIDLRSNPGGLKVSMQLALGEVLDRQLAVGTSITRGGREKDWDSHALFSARYTGPIAVLVDGRSFSSSEIFAHVLQYHQRGIVIGRPTAGAVIASRNFSLPDGGRIQVPIEDYLGLDGQRLEHRGVKPDIAVAPTTLADLRAARDPAIEAALQELKKTAALASAH